MRYKDIYREREYVDYLLATKDLANRKTLYEVGLIYKYYREQYDKQEAYDKVLEFLNEQGIKQRGFFKKGIGNFMERVVRNNEGRKLRQAKDIPIYKSDLEYVNNQPLSLHYRKCLFTLIVLMKIEKQLFLENKKNKNIKYRFYNASKSSLASFRKRSNIPSHVSFNKDVLPNLYSEGYLNLNTKGHVPSLEVVFLDNIENDDEVILTLNTFQNLGLVYEYLLGENIIQCCDCGEFAKATNNSTKYCPHCKEVREKERHIRYNRKRK